MKSKEVKIEGITYKVSSSTDAGLKDAIAQLKKSLKPKTKSKPKKDDDQDAIPTGTIG